MKQQFVVAPRSAMAVACIALTLLCATANADQSALKPVTSRPGPVLRFDWPAIEIGTATYEEGPTGVTVFHFPQRASASVDVRGGAPGTVNTDAFRLGIDEPFLDAVAFAGGSMYGQEAIAAVAPALKDLGVRGSNWGDVAVVAGAIIYDFRDHRLNDIYPDKALARAAVATMRPGLFPLGAAGAGRMATQGDFFGCTAHSGQGGAFRTDGPLRIAAFVVVNAGGAVTDRGGNLVRCHRNPAWGEELSVSRLLSRVGTGTLLSAPAGSGPTHNTTLSLIVTNRKMAAWELQRLAIQVHTSMARAIQPFSTEDDGDALYAVSTQELPPAQSPLSDVQLDTVAGEVMWDAILASAPDEPAFVPGAPAQASASQLSRLVGHYTFAAHAAIDVTSENGSLRLTLTGPDYYDLTQGKPVVLVPLSATEFYVDGRYHTRVAFGIGHDGRAISATIDPGSWAQLGLRSSP